MGKLSISDINDNKRRINEMKKEREKKLRKAIKVNADILSYEENKQTTLDDSEYEEAEEEVKQMYLKLGIYKQPKKDEGQVMVEELEQLQKTRIISNAVREGINKLVLTERYGEIPYSVYQGYRDAVVKKRIGSELKTTRDKINKLMLGQTDLVELRATIPVSRVNDDIGDQLKRVRKILKNSSIREKINKIQIEDKITSGYKTINFKRGEIATSLPINVTKINRITKSNRPKNKADKRQHTPIRNNDFIISSNIISNIKRDKIIKLGFSNNKTKKQEREYTKLLEITDMSDIYKNTNIDSVIDKALEVKEPNLKGYRERIKDYYTEIYSINNNTELEPLETSEYISKNSNERVLRKYDEPGLIKERIDIEVDPYTRPNENDKEDTTKYNNTNRNFEDNIRVKITDCNIEVDSYIPELESVKNNESRDKSQIAELTNDDINSAKDKIQKDTTVEEISGVITEDNQIKKVKRTLKPPKNRKPII